MSTPLPCAVLIRVGLGSTLITAREHLGLLLEWKRVVDDRGVASWRGLVVYALPPDAREGGRGPGSCGSAGCRRTR